MEINEIEKMFNDLENVRKAIVKVRNFPNNVVKMWAKSVFYFEGENETGKLLQTLNLIAKCLGDGVNGDI